ncbi:MAG TPA: arsenite methyltransferase [Bacteroidota bacterium]|nr:arsenite methyltransferase [Bacteroidota bacterium]
MSDAEIKSAIKEKYGDIARNSGSCCGPKCGCGTDEGIAGTITMNDLYKDADADVRKNADLGLGCGTPTAFADLVEGMTVLDLGSGAGIDVFLAAQKVGRSGRAIGVDMTEDMIRRADENKAKLKAVNTEFRLGEIENLPVATGSVDRIVSNCVINLVPDKTRAFSEMYRVLKPGGKFTVSDIVSVGDIPDDVRKDLSEWAGCVAGAIDREDYLAVARNAGFRDVTVVSDRTYTLDAAVTFGLHSITVSGTR